MHIGRVTLDVNSRQVSVGKTSTFLPSREFTVLEILMRNSGQVVTKKQIQDRLLAETRKIGPNAVEVYVHRLRNLLSDSGADIEVHTVHGVGYLLRAQT